MIHPEIYAALVRERTSTLLAQAEAARRAKPPAPPATGRPVRLRDGSAVLIRPVRTTDAGLIADGFARLSHRSRRMRFLGTKTSCPPRSCATSPMSTTTTTRRSAR